ncbi:MAG TPA: hypothetical protein VK427_27955 [Kofleriaceae bacterium]|nr:hypothetical protein [Kofleriaceae bacterium]
MSCAVIVACTPAEDAPLHDDITLDDAALAAGTITYRAGTTASAKSVTSLTIAKPAGVVSGDVLIARIANRNQVTATLTAPAGWTVLRSDQSSSQLKSWVAYKHADGAEPTSYTFDVRIASYVAGSISAFAGADPTSPIDAVGGQKNGTSATLAAPAVTTSAANGVAVWLGTQIWTGAACPSVAIEQPPGFTEAFDMCLVSSSQGLLFDAAYVQLGAAGTQPGWSGSSPFSNTNTAQVVTLRPAGTTCSAAATYAPAYTTIGSLTATEIVEASGLAASRVNPDVLYVHGEDNPAFVAIDKRTAAVVGSYTAGLTPWDWEDIATGPCPAGSCLYMGDIGKASGPQPTTFAIYRMKEPSLTAGETSGTIAGEHFPFQYPAADGAQNAEALMVHPTTAQIYVVTKSATGVTHFYKFPSPLPAPGTMSTLVKLDSVTLPAGPPDNSYREVTAGAIHPCANRFVLRTYRRVLEFRAPDGGTFEEAFAVDVPVALTDTAEGQGESIEYEPDGSGYFTMSERAAAPYTLKRVARE